MKKMHKAFLTAAILFAAFGNTAADAEVDLQVNMGTPVYEAPPPPPVVYTSPYPTYYDPWHRRHNHEYWRARRDEHHERYEHR